MSDRVPPTRSERFWAKLDRSAGPNGCWPFTGAVNEDVTHAENGRRGNAHLTRSIYGHDVQTHCKHGHEFTDQNTWRDKAGHRYCRTCNRNKQRNRRRSA